MLKNIMPSRKGSLRPRVTDEATLYAHRQGHSKTAQSGLKPSHNRAGDLGVSEMSRITRRPALMPASTESAVTVEHQDRQTSEDSRGCETEATRMTLIYQDRSLTGPQIGIALGSPRFDNSSPAPLDSGIQAFIEDSMSPPVPEQVPMTPTSAAALSSKMGKWRGLGGFLGKKHGSKLSPNANCCGETRKTVREQRRSPGHLDPCWVERSPSEKGASQLPRRKLSKARQGERQRHDGGRAKFLIQRTLNPVSSMPSSPCPVNPDNLETLKENATHSPMGKPLLEIEIPNVEMERYSIMFGSLLSRSRPASIALGHHEHLTASRMLDHLAPAVEVQSDSDMELRTLDDSACLKRLSDQMVEFSLTEKTKDSSPSTPSQFILVLHSPSEPCSTPEMGLADQSIGQTMLPEQHALRHYPHISDQRHEAVSSALSPEQLPARKFSLKSSSASNDTNASSTRLMDPLHMPSISSTKDVRKAAEISITRQISVSQRQQSKLSTIVPTNTRKSRTPTPKP